MFVVDGAVLWPTGKIYFFSDNKYLRYDIASEKMDGPGPLPIAGNWRGLPASGIQGGVAWPNGKAYFFAGDKYFRFDIASDQTDPGSPFPTRDNWKGIISGANRNVEITAAVIWPTGKAYLFQEDRYYSYDVKQDKMDAGYPRFIQDGWPGLRTTGQDFTAALVWPKLIDGRAKAYFFHRTLYLRYDIADDRVDPGFPQEITGKWSGL
jgi:hypothetical protein